jgi:hypothetical protein
MRRVDSYMKWEHKRNEDILTELKRQDQLTDDIKHYQEN